jgi:hypothetical protein
MKLTSNLKRVTAILLISHSLAVSAQANTADTLTPSKTKPIAHPAPGKASQPSASYSGYSVDGRTSASVIAAKRSHTVSKQDENGLAIYSGIFVIGLIAFFVHTLSKNK